MLSVIIPTHNPRAALLRRTLAALRSQTMSEGQWEVVVIDNASDPVVTKASISSGAPERTRVVRESRLGLSHARRSGLNAATGDLIVFVDDDNVLAPDYLSRVERMFQTHPAVGVLGGRIVPEYLAPAPAWVRDFESLLACRDLGPEALISRGLCPSGRSEREYPAFAPVGAGMALRAEAGRAWMNTATGDIPDRKGTALSSGGDNDIVLAAMECGWEVAYFPQLRLTHLIPAERLTCRYLARLNYGIQRSWMKVLTAHRANPWPPVSRVGAELRKLRAFASYHAWRSDPAWIRWRGACGHFEGRVNA